MGVPVRTVSAGAESGPGATVLVTGASGVVGTALLRELDGLRVHALTHHRAVTGTCTRGDVTRPWLGLERECYRRLARETDVVVHCAASVNFAAPPARLGQVNVEGTRRVLQFVADAGARLVHTSTAFVSRAGNGSSLDAYAASKAAGEELVHDSGLPAVVARLSTVIGDSRTGEIARRQAFHHVLGSALAGRLPFLPCPAGTRVDFLPQDTVASALAALVRTAHPAGVYWLTAGAAALPMTRIIDLAYRALTARAGTDPALRDVDLAMFRTRLLDPAVCERVVTAVLERSASTSPSLVRTAADHMRAFHHADPFPTSLGTALTGHAQPTEAGLEAALVNSLNLLLERPPRAYAGALHR